MLTQHYIEIKFLGETTLCDAACRANAGGSLGGNTCAASAFVLSEISTTAEIFCLHTSDSGCDITAVTSVIQGAVCR